MRFIVGLAFLLLLQAASAIAAPCGGIRGLQCGGGEWCQFPEGSHCGRADRMGSCQPRPQVCTRIYLPVCACNGQTYPNACEAHGAGWDVAHNGACRD